MRDLLEQRLLLILHPTKSFLNGGVPGLQSFDFAEQAVRALLSGRPVVGLCERRTRKQCGRSQYQGDDARHLYCVSEHERLRNTVTRDDMSSCARHTVPVFLEKLRKTRWFNPSRHTTAQRTPTGM